ncbi:MAG: ABC transporter permease, partial [Cyanobacteria bacterium J06649_11]
ILPQGIRYALPNIGNEMILLVKGSSLVSTITVMELTATTKTIVAETYMSLEFYITAGVMYLCINYAITLLVMLLERLYTPRRMKGLNYGG